jgi:DNA-binding NarL/FixJ family response regulator
MASGERPILLKRPWAAATDLRSIVGMPRELESPPEKVVTLLDRLSPGELEVLELVSTGSTNREIGLRLALSVHAVKFRLASAYRKLGVANRTQATSVLLSAHGVAEQTREPVG